MSHGVFIGASLLPGARAVPLLHDDAATYVAPAENLLSHGVFSRADTPPYLWEPYRTPGYPALIAAAKRATGSIASVLFLAAVTAGLLGWTLVRWTASLGGSVLAQHVTGLVAAFLPNSLGLSSEILTDAVFGHIFVVWMVVTIGALARPSAVRSVVSAGLMAILQSLRPTLNLGIVLLLAVGVVWTKEARGRRLLLAVVVASLVVPGYFAYRVERDYGIWSPTLLSAEATRNYLQPHAMHLATRQDYGALSGEIRRSDEREASRSDSAQPLDARLYDVRQSHFRAYAAANRGWLLLASLVEMGRQLFAPQEFCFTVFMGKTPRAFRVAGSLLSLLVFALATWGALALRRRDWRPGLTFFVTLGYFLLTGSISHMVGARLRLPADFVALPFAGIGVAELLRQRRRHQGQITPVRAAA